MKNRKSTAVLLKTLVKTYGCEESALQNIELVCQSMLDRTLERWMLEKLGQLSDDEIVRIATSDQPDQFPCSAAYLDHFLAGMAIVGQKIVIDTLRSDIAQLVTSDENLMKALFRYVLKISEALLAKHVAELFSTERQLARFRLSERQLFEEKRAKFRSDWCNSKSVDS